MYTRLLEEHRPDCTDLEKKCKIIGAFRFRIVTFLKSSLNELCEKLLHQNLTEISTILKNLILIERDVFMPLEGTV